MKERFDHLTILLYAGAIILICLLVVSVRIEKNTLQKPLPELSGISTVTESVPETAEFTTAEPYNWHRPRTSVKHIYTFNEIEPETVEYVPGMLSSGDLKNSRFFDRPAGYADHVFREENGIRDRYIYGTGPVGEGDSYAEYVFRYDPESGEAVAFIQEQHIDTGGGLNENSLSVYASSTRYLLDAVFSGTDINTATDQRKIEELALYFFSSYIPAHPVIPAVIHFRMPAYMLTFVMDSDVFITLISPDGIPEEYRVENEMD